MLSSSQKLERAISNDVPPTFLVLMKISFSGWQMIIASSGRSVFAESFQKPLTDLLTSFKKEKPRPMGPGFRYALYSHSIVPGGFEVMS